MKSNLNYPKLIIKLRIEMNISQEERAKRMGVSFQSVNRWENGKFEPTKLAKAKLDELFTEYDITLEE